MERVRGTFVKNSNEVTLQTDLWTESPEHLLVSNSEYFLHLLIDWSEASKTINLAWGRSPRSGCRSTGFTAEALRNVRDLLQLWEMRDDFNIYWRRERCETHLQLVPPQVLNRNPRLDQLRNVGEDESLFFKGVSVLWHLDFSPFRAENMSHVVSVIHLSLNMS